MADLTAEFVNTISKLVKDGLTPQIGEYKGFPIVKGGHGVVFAKTLTTRPIQRDELALVKSVDSFILFVNDHNKESSVMFVDQDKNCFGTVFDYEDTDGALAGKFKAKLVLEKTSAMAVWDSHKDQVMSQEDFAMFLEANATDIAEPESATMIAVAQELRAVKGVQFESKVKLESGSFVFSYKEETKGTVGKFEIPKSFFIGIPAYKGQPDAYKIECKFRYRVTPNGVTMWYSMPLLERVYEKAFGDVRQQILDGTKMTKVYDATIGF